MFFQRGGARGVVEVPLFFTAREAVEVIGTACLLAQHPIDFTAAVLIADEARDLFVDIARKRLRGLAERFGAALPQDSILITEISSYGSAGGARSRSGALGFRYGRFR
jgi:hypothetical protein